MYYLFYDKKTKRVAYLSKEPLKKQPTDYYGEAEFYGELPNKYDYLTITNLQEKTNTWTEKEQVEKLDEQGNTIFTEQGEIAYEEIEVPKSRTYFVCDLVANFRPALTDEQKVKLKENKYNALVTKFVREKYDANAVEALLANYIEDKEKYQVEFDDFATYRKECKARANKEVYGV